MNFIRNRNFRAGPQTSLDGFICPQNSKKQLKFRVFGRSEEGYKREILRLRIENERLKKKYLARRNEDGQTEYVRLKMKSLK